VYEFMKHIGFEEICQMGGITTAFILALSARLTMLKQQQGHASALFFSYARRTDKSNLKAVQLWFLG
jgi:hypothetical protein